MVRGDGSACSEARYSNSASSAGTVLGANGPSRRGGLDVAESGVDPFEGGGCFAVLSVREPVFDDHVVAPAPT